MFGARFEFDSGDMIMNKSRWVTVKFPQKENGTIRTQ